MFEDSKELKSRMDVMKQCVQLWDELLASAKSACADLKKACAQKGAQPKTKANALKLYTLNPKSSKNPEALKLSTLKL